MNGANAQTKASLEEIGITRWMPYCFDHYGFRHHILLEHVEAVIPDILAWLEEICGRSACRRHLKGETGIKRGHRDSRGEPWKACMERIA